MGDASFYKSWWGSKGNRQNLVNYLWEATTLWGIYECTFVSLVSAKFLQLKTYLLCNLWIFCLGSLGRASSKHTSLQHHSLTVCVSSKGYKTHAEALQFSKNEYVMFAKTWRLSDCTLKWISSKHLWKKQSKSKGSKNYLNKTIKFLLMIIKNMQQIYYLINFSIYTIITIMPSLDIIFL